MAPYNRKISRYTSGAPFKDIPGGIKSFSETKLLMEVEKKLKFRSKFFFCSFAYVYFYGFVMKKLGAGSGSAPH